jgi:Transposase DDE domain.
MKIQEAKTLLQKAIQDLDRCKWLFTCKPQKDFSRKRKLSFEQIVQAILCMRGSSLSNEMMDIFGMGEDLATSSAFVQQRSKILPEAFEGLFDLFTQKADENKTYEGFRLLAADGSDFVLATNPNDPDSFFPGTEEQKPYNLLHLNAMFDLVQHIYTDAVLQKRRKADECGALVSMIDRSQLKNVLLLIDRGYEAFNVLAHIQEKNWKFLVRVKDGFGGIACGLDLPDATEFDVPISLNLTVKQTNAMKRLLKDKNHYKLIGQSVRFDYLPRRSRKHDPVVFYNLAFRVVRFPISDTSFETVLTNLDAASFPPSKLKELYAMRWGIETSFRELKYTIGLQHFHSKKVEFVSQEIFARLTMYNFYEVITQSVVIQQKSRKYAYKVNFSAAVHICRQFFLGDIPPPRVEALLKRHISPIRPGRSRPRKLKPKQALSFLYRVA